MARTKRPSDKMINMLRVMLTERDRAAIDKAAKAANLDTSTWVRVKILELIRKSQGD
jgi:hypothetical protein